MAFLVVSAIAVVLGLVHAARLFWTSDDAYISFRYAENLNHGLGLVFNAGERVEGYSNFLWTLWCALGLRLGAAPETWAGVSGIACYGGTLALLAALAWLRRGNASWPMPLAALLGAVHHEWAVYATGGLETSLVTLLVVAGYVLLVGPAEPRAFWAGVAFALASLARPDGALFAAGALVFLLWTQRRSARTLLAYVAPLVAIGAPYALWKLSYYHALLPNTFYAKSAYLSWWSQGLIYVGLYFQKYWVLLLAIPLAFLWGSRPTGASDDTPSARAVALASLFALTYTGYVAYVGGDFMYARLLIPATPFFLVLLEGPIQRLELRARAAVVALCVLGLFTPSPVSETHWVSGVADERAVYARAGRHRTAEIGKELGRMFRGLPVRIAFRGAQAILAYESRAPVAIEAMTGLTDSLVAHQTLAQRGRVGHEKAAPYLYLIEQRHVHLLIDNSPGLRDTLGTYVPAVFVHLGRLDGWILWWDPEIMAALAGRGARFADFPAYLDGYLDRMPELDDARVASDYVRFRRFYFDHVSDPRRERPFLARLTGG
jgi:hypothetical protein